jgi:hypothetical protein
MHELTEQLSRSVNGSIGKAEDKVIRSYLEKAYEELIKAPVYRFRNVLGLDGVEEPKKAQGWCEHTDKVRSITVNYLSDGTLTIPYFNYCPECGTPRPKEKTLAEKFCDAHPICKQHGRPHMSVCEILAKVAEDHFKGKDA